MGILSARIQITLQNMSLNTFFGFIVVYNFQKYINLL